MIYSDFHINKDIKVEILPSDSFNQETDVLEQGDRLISIYRPIGSHSAMQSIKGYFIDELKHNYERITQNISELLSDTVEAFTNSLVNPPSDSTLDGEVELLIIYENPKKELIVAKVGSIQLKKRIDGKFKNLIEDSAPISAHPDTVIMVRKID